MNVTTHINILTLRHNVYLLHFILYFVCLSLFMSSEAKCFSTITIQNCDRSQRDDDKMRTLVISSIIMNGSQSVSLIVNNKIFILFFPFIPLCMFWSASTFALISKVKYSVMFWPENTMMAAQPSVYSIILCTYNGKKSGKFFMERNKLTTC